MRYILIISFLFLLNVPVISQNLLANGDFEDENICTEYTKNCAPEAWTATSLWSDYYFYEAQFAFSGNHCVGLTAGSISKPGVRNFIRSRLLCGLRPGHRYIVEFYVRSLHAVLDSIGVYFSNIDFLYDYLYMRRDFKTINPQLWVRSGLDSAKYDQSIWQKVHFEYTASGNEEYIAIGNFKKLDNSNIRQADYKNDFYFFLDKVSVTPLDSREQICTTADSVKKVLYDENARHNYLELLARFYKQESGTQPKLPKTLMPPETHVDTLVVPDIFFKTNSYELSMENLGLLDSFSTRLSSVEADSVVIEGHTDSIGKFEYNLDLSLHRASSIKDYILNKNPSLISKIFIRGMAYLKPVATNKTEEGRSQNRRVEILVYVRE